MSRIFFSVVTILLAISIIGCGEAVQDDPRFQVDPVQTELIKSWGFSMPETAEIDLVEAMAANRNEYLADLKTLAEYYESIGDATKRKWVGQEIDSLLQYQYVMPAEVLGAGMLSTDSIEEADKLYEEAMQLYNQAGGMFIITNVDKLRVALNKFNLVISRYPSSDKIDDSAYRIGHIHEYFKDYRLAAVHYQRTFQWNETTPYPARFKAALMYDKYLQKRDEALTLYQLACKKESRFEENTEYALRRIRQMREPELKSEIKTEKSK